MVNLVLKRLWAEAENFPLLAANLNFHLASMEGLVKGRKVPLDYLEKNVMVFGSLN